MMCFGSFFLINIFSIFTLYTIYVRQNYEHVIEAIIQLSWNVYSLLCCFVTVFVSSLVTRTGKVSAVLCHRAINYSDDNSIIDHVRIVYLLKTHLTTQSYLSSSSFSHNKCDIEPQLSLAGCSRSTLLCCSL